MNTSVDQLARYRRHNSKNREVLAERARRRRERAEVRERNSSTHSTWRQRNRAYVLEQQKCYRDTVRSVIPVTRTGKYTAAEDSQVARNDISIREIAYQLGRSYGSVTERRRRLRKEIAA